MRRESCGKIVWKQRREVLYNTPMGYQRALVAACLGQCDPAMDKEGENAADLG